MTTSSTFPTIHDALRHPAAGETTLFLVRHGRTASNVQQLLCGSTDSPLDPHGIRQAHLIAERISREVHVDVLLASPLSRALTTARIIGERIDLEPEIVPGLTEIDFGALEGATFDAIQRDHPELALRMTDIHDHEAAWPQGESRTGFHARVLATFQAILADYASHSIVVVSHGGVIGSFLAQIQGASPNDISAYQISNCGLSHLMVTPEHTAVHLLNDVLHLAVLVDEESGA